jgi:DNA modification methylase
MTEYKILVGDCVATMNDSDKIAEESVDHIITDPPYEIGFMGNGWDNSGVAYNPDTWRAAHRVLKPDGLMLVFGATRTHHRMAHAIERADFEILDVWSWCYGTGFPKSHNISKALRKKGHEAEAEIWDGYGTALKPAWEPIIVARKKGSSATAPLHQFFYIPKAAKSERSIGLPEGMINTHPTVKPIALMEALTTLVSQNADDWILDPFMGSGSTGVAVLSQHRNFIGCELTEDYIPIAQPRLSYAKEKIQIGSNPQ